MSTNPTYSATCPITGEAFTRTSAHPYTHAVGAIVVRIVADRTPGREDLTVRTRGQKLPEGFRVVRQPGRACWGHAAHYTPRAPEAFEERTFVLGTFHHSEKLARSAVSSYLSNMPSSELVRAGIVAVTTVARTPRQQENDAAEADAAGAIEAAERAYRADVAACDARKDAGVVDVTTWVAERNALHNAIKAARRELIATARRTRAAYRKAIVQGVAS